ncbi:XRE family transcriptional regulator [Sphingomonas sp. LY54]|uniref:helix-turn-helix domain-containing protein n=1 Tax=Sphingomonas sp. LY54 TaxID=3095343 RepID=UPI002D779065|nr:XRE family transcriptional regulator [Sphingomonas sp. LY54]WRP30026.1 XRE family transcriptional regulator [Sphingomonas sp. LY54]
MKQFEARLVEAVKRKREAEGLSLRALSTVVGISFSTLARIERGEGLPDNNSKIRLLEWLGPAADEEGLSFENVALVHFRAGKNVRSGTVQALLRAAECLKRNAAPSHSEQAPAGAGENGAVSLSKEELERTAEKFREDLGLHDNQPLDSLLLEIEGVEIIPLRDSGCIDHATRVKLSKDACDEWSAMSVPLDQSHEQWSVLLNDCHSIERQRVTLLEEVWHILLGHKLTKISKVAEAYGRTYDSVEEHDAYYLASAALLPRKAVIEAVSERRSSIDIAHQYGTSPELVDYRIKRLGLWRDHVGKRVALVQN